MERKRSIPLIFRRWSVWLSAAILLVTAGLKWNASRMPDYVTIPAPIVPSPNARDYYTTAEALEKDKNAVEWASDNEIIDNTYPDIEYPMSKWIPTDRLLTLREKMRLIAENAAAIAKLHEGMRHPYCDPVLRSDNEETPYSQDLGMAHLLAFQGKTLSEEGNWSGAADSYLDGLKLAADLQQHSGIVGALVGFAIHDIVQRNWAAVIPHLKSEEAAKGAHRLEAIDGEYVPYDQIVTEDKWQMLSHMPELFKHKNWRTMIGTLNEANSAKGLLSIQLESPRDAYSAYVNYIDAQTKFTRLSWPDQKRAGLPAPPKEPLTNAFASYITRVELMVVADAALDRLLDTQLALQAYEASHKQYPADLNLLVPRYLSHVPIDPFSNNAPLSYRRTADSYVLYSIGPDAVDNGGRPIANTGYSKRAQSQVTLNQNETGDIVAGINH